MGSVVTKNRHDDAPPGGGRVDGAETPAHFPRMDNSESPYSGPVSGAGAASPPPTYTTVVMSKTREAARAGITMGSALAITISWSVNHSILWAILHGFFSWLYVIYYAFTHAR